MTTVLVLLVCLSSVVRAYGPNDESSVAGMVKAMAKQITTLTAALEARQMDRKHIQLTTGGEVVELVRIADVKALTEQMEAYERKMDAQDARLAAQELARITELDATTAKLAVQEARISELSATVAQLLATGARPMPVDADKTLETTAARRLREAGSPPPSPSQPPPSPSPPPPPAWPPLPATANELRISGRHTAISFNTNVDGVEPFRCTGVGDAKLTCSGELKAADFRTASGISLEELARFAGMVLPSAPPTSPAQPPPPPPSPPRLPYAQPVPGFLTLQYEAYSRADSDGWHGNCAAAVHAGDFDTELRWTKLAWLNEDLLQIDASDTTYATAVSGSGKLGYELGGWGSGNYVASAQDCAYTSPSTQGEGVIDLRGTPYVIAGVNDTPCSKTCSGHTVRRTHRTQALPFASSGSHTAGAEL